MRRPPSAVSTMRRDSTSSLTKDDTTSNTDEYLRRRDRSRPRSGVSPTDDPLPDNDELDLMRPANPAGRSRPPPPPAAQPPPPPPPTVTGVTLVLSQIPTALLKADVAAMYFEKFGHIVNMAVDLKKAEIRVTFASNSSATAAVSVPPFGIPSIRICHEHSAPPPAAPSFASRPRWAPVRPPTPGPRTLLLAEWTKTLQELVAEYSNPATSDDRKECLRRLIMAVKQRLARLNEETRKPKAVKEEAPSQELSSKRSLRFSGYHSEIKDFEQWFRQSNDFRPDDVEQLKAEVLDEAGCPQEGSPWIVTYVSRSLAAAVIAQCDAFAVKIEWASGSECDW